MQRKTLKSEVEASSVRPVKQRLVWTAGNAPFYFLLLAACAVLLLKGIPDLIGNPYIHFHDFHIYQRAAERFLLDPSTLYQNPHTKAGFSGWFYPPPAVLIFVPFAHWSLEAAYFTFLVIMVLTAVAAVWLWARHASHHGATLSLGSVAPVSVVCLALGPTYHNAIFGQVNFFVLLSCIAYLLLLDKGRPLLAGIVLALGIWLKLYPVLLLVFAFRDGEALKSAVAAGAATLALPLLLLPLVTFGTYVTYFETFLPELSRYTVAHIMNQSFEASILRALMPLAGAFSWQAIPLSSGLKATNAALLVISLLGLVALEYWGVIHNRSVINACVLALIPMFSPLGWGYTYALAIPVMIQCYVSVRHASLGARFAFVIFISLFFVPPMSRIDSAEVPKAILDMFYARYFLCTLGLGVLLLWQSRNQPIHERRREQYGATTAILPHQ